MINPEVRRELEKIQKNLENEMEHAVKLMVQYGEESGINFFDRMRLSACIKNAFEVYDELLYPEKYGF